MKKIILTVLIFLTGCAPAMAQEATTVSAIDKQVLPQGKTDTQIIDVPENAKIIRYKLDRSSYTDETQIVSVRPQISYDGGQKWQDLSGGFDTVGGDYFNNETNRIEQFSYGETVLDQAGNKNRKVRIAVTVGKQSLETACEIEFK